MLKTEICRQNPDKKMQVMKLHNYLYKFSLLRLQDFLQTCSLVHILFLYFEKNGFNRVHNSASMMRYKQAYYEAANIMLKGTPFPEIPRLYNVDQVLKVALIDIEEEVSA